MWKGQKEEKRERGNEREWQIENERDSERESKRKNEKRKKDLSFIFDFWVNTVCCTCLPTLKSMLPSPSLSNILKSWSRNTSPASPSGMRALNITFILSLSILPSGQSAMKPCNVKVWNLRANKLR